MTTPEATLDADVLVIGSGAGGAATAATLAAAGRDVTVVEVQVIGKHEADVGMSEQELELCGNLARHHYVVCVDEGEQRSERGLQPAVSWS